MREPLTPEDRVTWAAGAVVLAGAVICGWKYVKLKINQACKDKQNER